MSQTTTRRFKRRYAAVKNRGHERRPTDYGKKPTMSGLQAALSAFGTSRYVQLFLERHPKPTAPQPKPGIEVDLPASTGFKKAREDFEGEPVDVG